MQKRLAAVLALVISGSSWAVDAPQSYADAKAIWQQHMNGTDYQTYSAEFAQFNNHFHLDEKDGCYALAPGPVNLMLVITHPSNDEFAVIDQVLSDVDNAKSRCFKNTYRGVRTKIPPFLPFVLQLGMG
ncbi:MAG: hypothetical protein ACLPV8_21190 [Steroidobacteraceae bacterium]